MYLPPFFTKESRIPSTEMHNNNRTKDWQSDIVFSSGVSSLLMEKCFWEGAVATGHLLVLPRRIGKRKVKNKQYCASFRKNNLKYFGF